MKITESRIVGKKSQETCEDGIVETDDFIAVIDGSTSKTPHEVKAGMRNGRYAMLLISEVIRTMKADTTLDDFLTLVTAAIRQATPSSCTSPEERLTASAILYSRHHQQVWMVGDCQCIIDGNYHDNAKDYEDRIARERVALIRQGYTPSEARKAIVPSLLRAMQAGQNRTYAVIDGTPILRQGVKVIPTQGSHEIILASDGYPFLRPTLAESEQLLQQQITNDPQNISSFLATKGLVEGNLSFDDRSYIRFTP